MLKRGVQIVFIILAVGMFIFVSPNDSHANTAPFLKSLQSSFPLPDFGATADFFEKQAIEKNNKWHIEKKEFQVFENIYSRFDSLSRAVGNYIDPALRTISGSSRTEQRAGADIRSAINHILSFSFGDSVGTGGSLSPEEALRIRQQSDSVGENAVPFSSDDISELNVNAPSLFKEQTQFRKDIFLDGSLNALGGNVNLGSGNLTAGNVLYGLVAGDGISLSGTLQRPTIASLFWRQENDRIRTRQENRSLELDNLLFVSGLGTSTFAGSADIAGNLAVRNTLYLQKGLHFSGDVTLRHDGTATVLVPNELPNAWRIATSTIGNADLFSVSTNGSGSISFGTSSRSAFVSIASPESSARLWVGTNNQTDFYISENGAIGIGTKNPLSTLSINGTVDVSGTSEFAGDLRILSLTGCQGDSVLETDSDGTVVCGQDDNTRRSTAPGGSNNQVQYNSTGGFAGSAQFLFNGSSVAIATSSFSSALNIGGSVFLSGGLGVGNATTTSGILETSGLAYIGGLLKVGAGTSTFTGGIFADALRFNLPSCDSLDTDSTGAIICGSDANSGGVNDWGTFITMATGKNLTASSTYDVAVQGELNVTGTGTSTIQGNLASMGVLTVGASASSTIRGITATSTLGGLIANHVSVTKALTISGGGTSTFTGGVLEGAVQ